MTFRSVMMLLLALVLAWIAYFSANRWMASRMATGADADTSQVLAAASDIPEGTKIDATMITKVRLANSSITFKAFRDEKDVIGRFAKHAIGKGVYLDDGLVVERPGGDTLAGGIEQGKRAFTVRSNEVIGVAGFLKPGSQVDVIASRRTPTGIKSETLLENVKVLAVDQTKAPDKNDPLIGRAVTLEVDPSQAEQLARATEEGNVQLALRNPLDGIPQAPKPDPAPPPGVIKSVKPEPPPPTRAPPPPVDRREFIAVIRGTKQDKRMDVTMEPLPDLSPPPPTRKEQMGEPQ